MVVFVYFVYYYQWIFLVLMQAPFQNTAQILKLKKKMNKWTLIKQYN